LLEFCAATQREVPDDPRRALLRTALPVLKDRAKTFVELLDKAAFCLERRPLSPDPQAAAALDTVSRGMLQDLTPHLQNASWDRETLEAALNDFAAARGVKFGKLAGPLRAALSGRGTSPGVLDMMLVLGREESLGRLADTAAG
jgi:glutamyl-tRNA synthetase